MNAFKNQQLTENGWLLRPFPAYFIKCELKTTVIAGRSDHRGIDQRKYFIITSDISKWNEITLKKYIEMKLYRKDTAKRLSFLKY